MSMMLLVQQAKYFYINGDVLPPQLTCMNVTWTCHTHIALFLKEPSLHFYHAKKAFIITATIYFFSTFAALEYQFTAINTSQIVWCDGGNAIWNMLKLSWFFYAAKHCHHFNANYILINFSLASNNFRFFLF